MESVILKRNAMTCFPCGPKPLVRTADGNRKLIHLTNAGKVRNETNNREYFLKCIMIAMIE